MKKLIQMTVLAAFALIGCAAAEAAQTNLIQTLNLHLIATFQGPDVTNDNIISETVTNLKVSTGDIIQILGPATTNDFSVQARLLVVTPLPDGDRRVVVRDGATTVDVTRFFDHELRGAVVEKARFNTETSVAAGIRYGVHSFTLQDATNSPALLAHFQLYGPAVVPFVSVLNRQKEVVGYAYEYVAAVAGTGDFDGQPAILRGTISGLGRAVEILP